MVRFAFTLVNAVQLASSHTISEYVHPPLYKAALKYTKAMPGALQSGKIPGGRKAVDIRWGQQLAWENKKAKGFNTTDVPLEFC